ncbi:MAG: hypothetical protein AAF652_13065, partial [Cyanobacteria bacterium P01_C01_bin.72]
MNKNPLTKIADRLLKRQLRPIFSFVRRFRSRAVYGVYRFLPRSLRSSMPTLAKEANKYARQKLQERIQAKEQAKSLPKSDIEIAETERERLLPTASS